MAFLPGRKTIPELFPEKKRNLQRLLSVVSASHSLPLQLLQGLEDVQNVASTSSDGSAVIRAEFDWSGDPAQYFNDTVREVTAIRSKLQRDYKG